VGGAQSNAAAAAAASAAAERGGRVAKDEAFGRRPSSGSRKSSPDSASSAAEEERSASAVREANRYNRPPRQEDLRRSGGAGGQQRRVGYPPPAPQQQPQQGAGSGVRRDGWGVEDRDKLASSSAAVAVGAVDGFKVAFCMVRHSLHFTCTSKVGDEATSSTRCERPRSSCWQCVTRAYTPATCCHAHRDAGGLTIVPWLRLRSGLAVRRGPRGGRRQRLRRRRNSSRAPTLEREMTTATRAPRAVSRCLECWCPCRSGEAEGCSCPGYISSLLRSNFPLRVG
jgi:hypothetical protein